MSVEKLQRANGPVWRVRWRDEQGHPHSRVMGRKADATALDEELKRSKRIGTALPFQSKSAETLHDFAKLWWARYVVPSLARHTQLAYASMLDVHIVPRIGDLPLRGITAEVIWELRASMSQAGVGDAATRKTLVVLQSVLQRAVEWDRLESNPARLVRKPSQARTHVVRPLPPLGVEGIRAALLADGRQLDAALIAVLAYGGLRPGEALGLRWHDVRERTILVERSVAFGKLKTTKTGKTRTVRMLPALATHCAHGARSPSEASRPTSPSPHPTGRHGTSTVSTTGAGVSLPTPSRPPASRRHAPTTSDIPTSA